MKLNGGQALIKSLEMEGVEVIFGLPGGAILPVYDPIIDSPIRHILVRHEQGAGHMAEGYAHATGKPGVAMVTSGPGATNIVTTGWYDRREDGSNLRINYYTRTSFDGGQNWQANAKVSDVDSPMVLDWEVNVSWTGPAIFSE